MNAKVAYESWELLTNVSRSLGASTGSTTKDAKELLIEEAMQFIEENYAEQTDFKAFFKPHLDEAKRKRSKTVAVSITDGLQGRFLSVYDRTNTFANQGETAVTLALIGAKRRKNLL